MKFILENVRWAFFAATKKIHSAFYFKKKIALLFGAFSFEIIFHQISFLLGNIESEYENIFEKIFFWNFHKSSFKKLKRFDELQKNIFEPWKV